MSLPLPDPAGSLYAALIAGLFGLIYRVYDRRWGRERRQNAWRDQARQLSEEINALHDQQSAYLRGELAKCNTEVKRLNRLLNAKRRGSSTDD